MRQAFGLIRNRQMDTMTLAVGRGWLATPGRSGALSTTVRLVTSAPNAADGRDI